MIREESRLGCAPGSDCCSECAGSSLSPESSSFPITPAAYIGIGIGLLIFFEAVTKKGNR